MPAAETPPRAALAGLPADALAAPGPPVVAGGGVLPVLPALRGLLPAGGLGRGQVVTAPGGGLLLLALAAGASDDGAWCAAVGLPSLGVRAAAEAGLDPARLLLVADPGRNWPQVTASLLDGCDLVLLAPPARPPAALRRRLEATARRCGSVLLVAGEWDGAQARLVLADQEWVGIGPGHGRLRARLARVVSDGRGAAARPRTAWLWLPGPDGTVTPAADGPPSALTDAASAWDATPAGGITPPGSFSPALAPVSARDATPAGDGTPSDGTASAQPLPPARRLPLARPLPPVPAADRDTGPAQAEQESVQAGTVLAGTG